jgi:GNAT superfamily N-acetyltransferase
MIRRYQATDAQAVIRVFEEFMDELAPAALRAEFRAYVEHAIGVELGRIDEYYLAREGHGFWVADDGGVIGMVGVERHSAGAAELRRMAVAASHRRRGIARSLLHTAEAFCREQGYATMVLSTSELQAPAMRLYESSGYRCVRTETATAGSHKTPGAGLTRRWYEKAL